MTSLEVVSKPSPPAPLCASLDVALARLTNAVSSSTTAGTIPIADAPSAPLRQALSDRRAELAPWLGASAAQAVVREVAGLFTGLRSRGGDERDLAIRIDLFASDLAGVPLWALTKACASFRRGEAGDGHWLPTSGDVRIVAMRHVDGLAREARAIDRVLAAKPVAERSSPERRAELAAEARRMFRIPDPVAGVPGVPGQLDARPDRLGELGREVLLKSGVNRIFAPLKPVGQDSYPSDRFDAESAA